MDGRPPDPKSTSEPQLSRAAAAAAAAGTGGERPADGDDSTASRAEGTRCRSRSFDGSDRKRPRISKERTFSYSGYQDFDRNQSPSRRSPKSPPRSPSWLRLRESPTRASCGGGGGGGGGARTRSPSSSSEKYPSKHLDDVHHTGLPCSEEYREYEAFLEERRNPPSMGQESSDVSATAAAAGSTEDQLGGHAAGDFYASDERNSIDLASFAATVASGTAHLTSMSFSPPTPQSTSSIDVEGSLWETVKRKDALLSLRSNLQDSTPEKGRGTNPSSEDSEEMGTEATVESRNTSLLILTEDHWSPRIGLSPIPDFSPSSETDDLDPSPLQRSRKPPHIEDIVCCSYGSWSIAETSPTFGTFKRCPSYNNILALPELEINDPGPSRPSQISSFVREEVRGQTTTIDASSILPNLPEEQEETKTQDETTLRFAGGPRGEQEEKGIRFGSSGSDLEGPAAEGGSPQRNPDFLEPQFASRESESIGDVRGEEIAEMSSSMYAECLTVYVEDQLLLSDEELREIDLDEELPPKHLLVRKSRRASLPMATNLSSFASKHHVTDETDDDLKLISPIDSDFDLRAPQDSTAKVIRRKQRLIIV